MLTLILAVLLSIAPPAAPPTLPEPPAAAEQVKLTATPDSDVRLDGRPCRMEDVPPTASIVKLDVAADKKTIIKLWFRSKGKIDMASIELTEKDKASVWYASYSHWGEAFIERESSVDDQEWSSLSVNGMPVKRLMFGLTFEAADRMATFHNATLGVDGGVAPWMRFDDEHDRKCLKNAPPARIYTE